MKIIILEENYTTRSMLGVQLGMIPYVRYEVTPEEQREIDSYNEWYNSQNKQKTK
jgi:hypothetical protein